MFDYNVFLAQNDSRALLKGNMIHSLVPVPNRLDRVVNKPSERTVYVVGADETGEYINCRYSKPKAGKSANHTFTIHK